VILPSARSVVREQREIFGVFAEVPVHTLRALRDSLAGRFAASARAGKSDPDDDEGGGGDDGAGGRGGRSEGGGRGAGAIASANDGGEGGAAAHHKHHHHHLDREAAGASGAAAASSSQHHTIRVEGDAVIAAHMRKKSADGDATPSAAPVAGSTAPPAAGSLLHRLCPCLARRAALRERQQAVKAAARAVAAARRHSGREYSKAAGSGVLPLVLRLLWPILVFSAYYIANFVWRSGVVAQARLAHASSVSAAELQFMAPLAGYLLRNTLYYSEPKWVASNLNATRASIDFLRSLVDAVAYGDASQGLPSALGTNKAAYAILLDNGCVHNEVSAAACANYGVNASCNYYYPYALCYKPPGKRVLARMHAHAAQRRARVSRLDDPSNPRLAVRPIPAPPLCPDPPQHEPELPRLLLRRGRHGPPAGRAAIRAARAGGDRQPPG
jgi:hypothetical protein